MESEKVTMKLNEKKKHSVRFDNKKSDVLRSVYLMNEAFERQREPKVIYIEVSSTPLVRQEEPDGG